MAKIKFYRLGLEDGELEYLIDSYLFKGQDYKTKIINLAVKNDNLNLLNPLAKYYEKEYEIPTEVKNRKGQIWGLEKSLSEAGKKLEFGNKIQIAALEALTFFNILFEYNNLMNKQKKHYCLIP